MVVNVVSAIAYGAVQAILFILSTPKFKSVTNVQHWSRAKATRVCTNFEGGGFGPLVHIDWQ